MSNRQEKCTIALGGSPPANLSSYTRSMHQHTMRQIQQMDKTDEGHPAAPTNQTPAPYPSAAANGARSSSGSSR